MFDLQLDLKDLYIEDLFPSSDEEPLDDDLKPDFDDIHGPFSHMWIYITFLTYDDFGIGFYFFYFFYFLFFVICMFVVWDDFETLCLCSPYDFFRVYV